MNPEQTKPAANVPDFSTFPLPPGNENAIWNAATGKRKEHKPHHGRVLKEEAEPYEKSASQREPNDKPSLRRAPYEKPSSNYILPDL